MKVIMTTTSFSVLQLQQNTILSVLNSAASEVNEVGLPLPVI